MFMVCVGLVFGNKNVQFHIICQGQRKIDNWGGGAVIYIFVLTDCKNNRFQKKLMMQNKNI